MKKQTSMEKTEDSARLDTEAGALQNIVAWSTDRPMWQRDALRRLCMQDSLTEADYGELLIIAKGDESNAQPLKAEHVPSPEAAYKTVNLKAIRDAQHVNALKSGECLSFRKGNGITVIYGDNGSGKSGYARILKSACRARTKETIRPHINSQDPVTPKANIEFTVDGQNESTTWLQDQETDLRLSAISVFDSKTANVHVDEKNEVAYNPFPLELLKNLSDACQKIQQLLNDEKSELEQQTPEALSEPKCKDYTEVGKLIAGLNEKTDKSMVASLGQLSVEEQKRYETLKVDLASDPISTARKLNSYNENLERHKTQTQTLCNAARDEMLEDIQKKYNFYLVKKEAAKVAAESLFKEENLPSIGADTWRSLWDAARRYSEAEAYPKQIFPYTKGDARCVLCHQTLSPEAAKRLENFEDFVNDEAKKAEEAAKLQYDQLLEEIEGSYINNKIRLLPEMRRFIKDDIGNADLAKSIKRCAVDAKWRLRKFLANHEMELSKFPLSATMPEEQLRAASKSLADRSAALTNEKNSEDRKKLMQEHDNLQDRRWLEVVKDDVIAEIGRIATRKRLGKLINENKTSKITNKSKELIPSLVTDALREKFVEETKKLELDAPHVELKHDHSKAASAFFRVLLSDNQDETVGAILSEGEFRCIALAAFMAEQATTKSNSAIVFDDPVSSLDHMRREQVATRLAEEAVNRQVVIFTHDLAFLFLLEGACADAQSFITYRSISRTDNFIGLCDSDAPPRARPIGKAIEGLAKHLENVKMHYENGNTMKWECEIGRFEKELRVLWERAVEEAIAPVLERFKNKVETKGLTKLTALTMDDCASMREAYGRCSNLLHSEGASLNRPLPKPQVVRDEINFLKEWVVNIRERQKEIDLSN